MPWILLVINMIILLLWLSRRPNFKYIELQVVTVAASRIYIVPL